MAFYRGAMPRGDYYNRAAGDYYARGDFWSKAKKSLKKIGKKVVRPAVTIGANYMTGGLASSFLPAAGAGGLEGLLGNVARGAANSAIDRGMAHLTGSSSGGGQVYVPEAVNNPLIPDMIEKLWDGKARKRRTMNPGNARALRRALARVESFRTLVKRSHVMPAVRRVPGQRGCGKASCKTC